MIYFYSIKFTLATLKNSQENCPPPRSCAISRVMRSASYYRHHCIVIKTI